jgi:hypothetical protein
MNQGAHYVFIGDQGRVFSSVDEPTADDLDYAAVGMLTIVSLRDLRYYGRESRWLPIPGRDKEVGDP